MISIEKIAPAAYRVEVKGKAKAEELERVVDAIEIALDENEKSHFLIEAEHFTGIEAAATGGYARRAVAMLKKLGRFGRIAVVSDQAWLRLATRIESALLPHISYETFLPAERGQARAWVTGETALPHGGGLKLIETGDPKVLAYEIDGRIGAAELEAAAACFAPAIASGETLRVFARIRDYGGIDMGGFLSAGYLRMKRDLLGRVDRYALVGAPLWMRAWAVALAPMFGVELRLFEPDEEALAWAWLGATPQAERPLVA